MPEIESVQEFEDVWVEWWSAAQPEWRDTASWPFSTDEIIAGDWGTALSSGGKDGLFLIVMSLRWWAHARTEATDSKLDAAISNVCWVMKNLVASLSADAITRTPSPDPIVTSSQP